MKHARTVLGKYVVFCLALMISYVVFLYFIAQPMRRDTRLNLLATEKVEQMKFKQEVDQERFHAIWHAVMKMDKLLKSIVWYQSSGAIIFLLINCAILYIVYRGIKTTGSFSEELHGERRPGEED